MNDPSKQHLIDLPKVIAGGVAAPLATVLTSRFGVAGTMIGLALSAITVTLIADVLKVYLARVPGAVTSIPGGFKKKSMWGRLLTRVRLPFSKFSSLQEGQRRSILLRAAIAGVIIFIIGLVIVTGVELSVGKNLSCWVWDHCYTESSASGDNASDANSLPSIFIAGNSMRDSASQVSPSAPQPQPQPQPAPPVAPASPSSPGASGKGSQPSVAQQPSASPSEQQSSFSSEQQQSESSQQREVQPQSEYRQQEEFEQEQNPTSSPQSQQSSDSQQQQSNTSPARQAPSGGTDDAGY